MADPPTNQPAAILHSVKSSIRRGDQDLLDLAIQACRRNQPVEWTLEYTCHDRVPPEIASSRPDDARDVQAPPAAA